MQRVLAYIISELIDRGLCNDAVSTTTVNLGGMSVRKRP
jgi:hypothetical protein